MLIRVISGAVALPILFFIVLAGGMYLELAGVVVSLIALYEFFKALRKKSLKPFSKTTYLLVLVVYSLIHFGYVSYLPFVIALYVASLFLNYLFNQENKFVDVGVTIASAFYVIFFFYHIILLSKLENSFYIWYVFIVSWGADTGAYFVGVKFGKRKLSPVISPNKSVEGAVGGILTAVIIASVFTYYNDQTFIVYGIIIAIFGSVISILGDLVASRIKREMDVKDFGNIMPGHGGIIDRFDSLLLVAPFVFYFIKFILTM